MEKGENYVLDLDEQLGFEIGECLNCVSFCNAKGENERLSLTSDDPVIQICSPMVFIQLHSAWLKVSIEIAIKFKCNLLICSINVTGELCYWNNNP